MTDHTNGKRLIPVIERAKQLSRRGAIFWLPFLFLLVVLVEITLFNIGHWQTANLVPQEYPISESVSRVPFGEELEFSRDGDDAKLGTQREVYRVNLDPPQDIKTLEVIADRKDIATVFLTDEGSKRKAYEIGDLQTYDDESSALSNRGLVYRMRPYGAVDSISIIALDTSTTISSVVINAPIPFSFSFLRVGALFLFCSFIYLFRARSRLYQIRFFSMRKRRIVAGALAVMMAACAVIGCFASNEYEGEWEMSDSGGWEYSYSDKARQHDQYAELARAFASGQLSLLEEPDETLAQMDNPYDPSERNSTVEDPLEVYRWDTAYFNGTYYVYFGVLPVLVFYLPWFLLTGTNFPTIVGCQICLAFIVVGIVCLLYRLLKRWLRDVSLGDFVLACVVAVLSSMLVYAIVYPVLYMMPITMGVMLAIWGSFFIMDPKMRVSRWALGSLCFGCILACRPQLELYCVLLIPYIIRCLRKKSKRYIATRIVAIILPAFIVGLSLGVYNLLRFGSMLDFGANYNLTTNDMTRRQASLELTLTSLFYYLIQPPSISTVFPFVQPTEDKVGYLGMFISEPMYGGILWLAPIIVVCFALKRTNPRILRITSILMVVCAICVAAFDATAAGVLSRYQMDFAFPLAMASSIIFCCWATKGVQYQKTLMRIVCRVGVIVSVFFSLGILYQHGWVSLHGFWMFYHAFSLL